MEQNKVFCTTGFMPEYRKISDFILADINRDGIPELLVNAPDLNGRGQGVYSYYNGKVVKSVIMQRITSYYPHSGVVVLREGGDVVYNIYYCKIAKGKVYPLAIGFSTNSNQFLVNGGKYISKSQFNAMLKKEAGKEKVEIKKAIGIRTEKQTGRSWQNSCYKEQSRKQPEKGFARK